MDDGRKAQLIMCANAGVQLNEIRNSLSDDEIKFYKDCVETIKQAKKRANGKMVMLDLNDEYF